MTASQISKSCRKMYVEAPQPLRDELKVGPYNMEFYLCEGHRLGLVRLTQNAAVRLSYFHSYLYKTCGLGKYL